MIEESNKQHTIYVLFEKQYIVDWMERG